MPEAANNVIVMEQDAVKPESAVKEAIYDSNLLGSMLGVYYKRLFPHKLFYRWLSYAKSELDIFEKREISFTMESDVYVRYQSFDDQLELEKWICQKVPHKIDIGAVMAARPRTFLLTPKAKEPVQRELVFDIDMTDYDDVRTCCSGTSVCQLCWKFMALAVRVLDTSLREDFGFEHMLWVFSGRRGVHCWVCDYKARHLEVRERSAVAEYLQILSHTTIPGGQQVARVQIGGDRLHHSVKRALSFIDPVFQEIILEDQNLFGTPKGIQKLLYMVNDENARSELEAYLNTTHEPGTHSRDIWTSFTRYVHMQHTTRTASIWSRKLRHILEEIKLCTVYPRLDINVSKGFNHLLKAPFCIHPGTGKFCTPFSASTVSKFDPMTVTNISQLLQEINAYDDKSKAMAVEDDAKGSRIKDYKKTSMFKGILVFEEFLRKMEASLTQRGRAISTSDQKMEF